MKDVRLSSALIVPPLAYPPTAEVSIPVDPVLSKARSPLWPVIPDPGLPCRSVACPELLRKVTEVVLLPVLMLEEPFVLSSNPYFRIWDRPVDGVAQMAIAILGRRSF